MMNHATPHFAQSREIYAWTPVLETSPKRVVADRFCKFSKGQIVNLGMQRVVRAVEL